MAWRAMLSMKSLALSAPTAGACFVLKFRRPGLAGPSGRRREAQREVPARLDRARRIILEAKAEKDSAFDHAREVSRATFGMAADVGMAQGRCGCEQAAASGKALVAERAAGGRPRGGAKSAHRVGRRPVARVAAACARAAR